MSVAKDWARYNSEAAQGRDGQDLIWAPGRSKPRSRNWLCRAPDVTQTLIHRCCTFLEACILPCQRFDPFNVVAYRALFARCSLRSDRKAFICRTESTDTEAFSAGKSVVGAAGSLTAHCCLLCTIKAEGRLVPWQTAAMVLIMAQLRCNAKIQEAHDAVTR